MPNFLHKPSHWTLTRGLIAQEWGWFWNASKHSTILAPNGGLPFDLGQRKILQLDGGTVYSIVSSDNRGRVIRLNDGATTDNTGLEIASSGGFLGGSTEFTIALYLRWHGINADTSNESSLYDEWGGGATNILFRYEPQQNRLEAFADIGGVKTLNGVTTLTVEDGEWETLLFTYDGSEIAVWNNGVQAGTPIAASGALGTATPQTLWCNQVSNTNDGGQWDVAVLTAQNRFWGPEKISQWSRDPFGPFRMVDEAGVVHGLPTVVAAANSIYPLIRRRRRRH